VTIEAVNGKSGERKVYHAHYAVGCDGGKSFVRKSLGKKIFISYA
jgi:2-polyprenyl-6-methoxyphenol hydroxylase-like FAD-dependent oxidoreductase